MSRAVRARAACALTPHVRLCFGSAILVGSFIAAQWVGWAHEDAPMLRRALPSGLALGVVIARTMTSLFDYAVAGVRHPTVP